jgi:hypothetical protein
LANEAIKPVRIGYTKQLGLFRQPQIGPILPVDGLSNFPVNKDEEPKEQVNMDMVESGISDVEFGKGSKIQSEGSSRTFSSKNHIFDKAPRAAYQSKEDLAKQYVEKGNLAMNEMRELILEVERISQHKSSLFTMRYV